VKRINHTILLSHGGNTLMFGTGRNLALNLLLQQHRRDRESRVIELPDKLLDLIYDAATEQELWRSALNEIADLTNSQGSVLFGQSVRASKVYFDYNGRLDEECNKVYRERHMHNPWSIGMESQPVGRIVFSDEIIALSSLRRTLFFDEVLRPQNVAHNVMISLAAKDDFRAAFNLRKVFAKTGTSRQIELARLIASIGVLKANSSGASDGK
jgi:hypothetical protein